MTPFQAVILLVGVFLAFSTFSFIWLGDTVAYDFCESIIMGAGVTMGLLSTYNSLQSSAFSKIAAGKWWLIFPIIIGALAFTRRTRVRWLARYPIAVASGVGVGVTLGLTVRAQLLDFLITNIDAVVKARTPIDIASALYVLVGGIFGLTYYMYSAKYSSGFHTGRLRFAAKIGRYVLFACFGYLYASVSISEGFDSLASNLIILVKRTIDALVTGVYE